MANVTGTESRVYSPREYLNLEAEARERNAPEWVSRELGVQALVQFFSLIRG